MKKQTTALSIYQIDKAIANCIDAETGEIIDIEKLSSLHMARKRKIENVAAWIINIEAEAKAIKEQEDILKARRTANENKVKRLKEYLSYALNGESFTTPRIAVSFRASEATIIDDESKIPDAYTNVVIERKPDKVAIKAALKQGIDVPGCRLEARSNIQIK